MQYKEGVKAWLLNRKISNEVLEKFNLGYDNCITIPIYDENGIFIYNKYRRNPLIAETGPKYWYDKGGKVSLYGAQFIKDEKVVVITEGELDCLLLWSKNIPAVSSTGGAMSFQKEWVEILKDKEIYICFDNDSAGCSGMVRVLTMLPQAKVILLPILPGVKDITDYYRVGEDLRNLMQSAKHYVNYEEVEKEKNFRKGSWQSITFHEAWINWWESEKDFLEKPKEKKKYDNDLEKAKSIPIEKIVKVNSQKKMLCLWHSDSNPSMQVYDDGHAYCFACNKRADVIDIVKEKFNLGFVEAVEYLNNL